MIFFITAYSFRFSVTSRHRASSCIQYFSTSPASNHHNKARALMEDLKDWRKRTADELQRPIYKVLTNQLLEDIVRMKPRTVQQLSFMNGVGPFKLRQYGKKIINIINAHITEEDEIEANNNVDTASFWDQARAAKEKKTKSLTKKIKKNEEEKNNVEESTSTSNSITDSTGSSISSKKTTKSKATTTATTNDSTIIKKAKRKIIPVLSSDEAATIESQLQSTISISDLNDEQRVAAEWILNGKNVFITGSAGTGKV
jgi:ribonuclease D